MVPITVPKLSCSAPKHHHRPLKLKIKGKSLTVRGEFQTVLSPQHPILGWAAPQNEEEGMVVIDVFS
jgi:hypothetical protein